MSPEIGLPLHATEGSLTRSLTSFFGLASALTLSEAENRALLDLQADTVTALRAGTMDFATMDQTKLQRRLDYAIPILQRMLASMTS